MVFRGFNRSIQSGFVHGLSLFAATATEIKAVYFFNFFIYLLTILPVLCRCFGFKYVPKKMYLTTNKEKKICNIQQFLGDKHHSLRDLKSRP